MKQIRNTWFKELGTIKLNCFNGKSVIIQDPRIPRSNKEPAGESNREVKSREIISLAGRQKKASTFALGEPPATEKVEFTF